MLKSIAVSLVVMGLGVLCPVAASQANESEVETLDVLRSKGDLRSPGTAVRGPITIIRPASLLLASMDRNGDYRIDLTEFETGAEMAFEAADTDRSGQLSLFELEDWRLAALGSHDAMPGNFGFDDNHDNRVERTEFTAALSFEFERNDKNEDGVLLFKDLIRVMEMPQGNRRGGAQAGQGRSEGGRGGERPRRMNDGMMP